jgi:hypothetical protein
MVTVNDIKTLTTLDELFDCHEARLAIRKSLSKIVRTLLSNQDEILCELTAEVAAALVKYLGGKKIKNTGFLKSPNRLGWLSLFARNTSRHWIADRVRKSLGDKRVQDALHKQCLPAETFEKYQARAREFAESLTFDPHQFAGERPRPRLYDPDGDPEDSPEPSQGGALEDERLHVLRDAVARLSKRDQTFVNAYYRRRRRPRTPAERKRFQRLVLTIRDLCHVSRKVAI